MKAKLKRVVLEPKLEAIAGHWDGLERIKGAEMFRRWARELEVTGFMMIRSADDDAYPSASAAQRLRRLKWRLSKRAAPPRN